MIQFSIINESCRCLDEKIAIRSTDIDVCSVFGMGYPSYRGGIMNYGKTIGFKKVTEGLNKWYEEFGLDFFKPCDFLVNLSQGKSKL
jgi:enoyl-CoA hydratase/3-hydroxyacyl-CoA dehydrogenase